MRVITIDNGNTNPHVGIFIDKKLQSVLPLKQYVPFSDDLVMIANVGHELNFTNSFDFKSRMPTVEFPFFFNMPVDYAPSIGIDRLILAREVFEGIKNTEETVLVLDAGTFITMDLVTHIGFNGGYIFPGLATFLACYQRGASLPHLNFPTNFTLNSLPHTTQEAILGATEIYLESILKDVIRKTSPSKITLTGGNYPIIKQIILKINSELLVESNPHLIHLAMYSIYDSHLLQPSH